MDEYKVEPCPDCDGTGKGFHSDPDPSYECPSCLGTGEHSLAMGGDPNMKKDWVYQNLGDPWKILGLRQMFGGRSDPWSILGLRGLFKGGR
ncbi:MAG: hypothetical protein AAGA90_23580 [Actinomycetota bacterium]